MFKKFLFITLFTLGLVLLFSSKAYAAVDITLEDNPVDKNVEVRINTNNEMISGIAMDIFFSDGMIIEEINGIDNFCAMGFNSVASNGIISIECLNDEKSLFNDILATISYTTNGEDYFFYINEDTVDIGDNDIGIVNNINKPENINIENTENNTDILIEEKKDDGFVIKIVDFIKEYYIYISLAVISIVILLLISLFKRP
jgi:hypothetical protein